MAVLVVPVNSHFMKLANIVISCPDKPGIVRAVTDFLFKNGANISFLEEHIEDGYFFMRVEWERDSSSLQNETEFAAAFASIQDEFGMNVKLDFNERKKRLGLLCSRELHCLIDILSRVLIGELNVEIPYVISNFADAEMIVEKFGVPFYHVPAVTGSFAHESKMLEIIRENPTDLIGLARYMKVLSSEFIDGVEQKIINVHHSFLPSFVGAKPYDEAYQRGVKLIGATSHYVTPDLDQGPIIEQDVKRIKHSHEIANLKLMGREIEKQVFSFAIRKHVENKLIIFKNRTIVFE